MTDQSSSAAQAAQESEVLKTTDVLITNTRAVIQNKTYALNTITSVSIGSTSLSSLPGLVLILLGAVGILIGISSLGNPSGSETVALFGGIGILFALLGYMALTSGKTQYTVRINSATGESNVLTSYDRDAVERIVRAMNEAIRKRR